MRSFRLQLLNRNPKHRLGAQRDAVELKEHPFFKSIDWKALSSKQVTPPFKPVVESDESVANFDPEFTSADLREAGLDSMDLDEEDPSEDWVAMSASMGAALHTPNGPLGSDRPERSPTEAGSGTGTSVGTSVGAGAGTGTSAGTSGTSPSSKSIPFAQKKKAKEAAGSPLTSSLQDNFRGFTYHGESVVVPGRLAEQADADADAEQDEQDEPAQDPTTDDEFGDEAPAGRYANRRHLDGFDEDMHV